MRRLEFTEEEREVIVRERFEHPNPRVQRRMEMLWLKVHGETHERIAELTGVGRRTVQVRHFLRDQLGLSWRKVVAVPVPPKKSVEEHAATQAAFLKYGA